VYGDRKGGYTAPSGCRTWKKGAGVLVLGLKEGGSGKFDFMESNAKNVGHPILGRKERGLERGSLWLL